MNENLFKLFKDFLLKSGVLEQFIQGVYLWQNNNCSISSQDLIIGAFDWYLTNRRYNWNINWHYVDQNWLKILRNFEMFEDTVFTSKLYQYLVNSNIDKLSIF